MVRARKSLLIKHPHLLYKDHEFTQDYSLITDNVHLPGQIMRMKRFRSIGLE
jgi:hypothetical protein